MRNEYEKKSTIRKRTERIIDWVIKKEKQEEEGKGNER